MTSGGVTKSVRKEDFAFIRRDLKFSFGNGQRGNYRRGLFAGGISRIPNISQFSRISRDWSDSSKFPTFWGLSKIGPRKAGMVTHPSKSVLSQMTALAVLAGKEKSIHHHRGNPPFFCCSGSGASMVYTGCHALLSGPMVYTLVPCFPRKMVHTIASFALWPRQTKKGRVPRWWRILFFSWFGVETHPPRPQPPFSPHPSFSAFREEFNGVLYGA